MSDSDTANVLDFEVEGERYCIEISNIQQTIFMEDAIEGAEMGGTFDTDDFGRMGSTPDRIDTDVELTKLPYSSEYLVGLLPFQDDTIEIVDTVQMFGLKSPEERVQEELEGELAQKFNTVEEAINEHIKNGGIDNDAASDLEEVLIDLRRTVMMRENAQIDLTGKEIIILSPSLSPTGRLVGLVVDEVFDVIDVTPADLDTSIRRDGIVGTIDREGGVMVWLDPRYSLSGGESEPAAPEA